MAGLTYYLLINPDKLALLTQELRSEFSSESEITMESTAKLKFLNACEYKLVLFCLPSIRLLTRRYR